MIAGVSHHPSYGYADGYDQTSGPEDLQRPASYMVSRDAASYLKSLMFINCCNSRCTCITPAGATRTITCR